MRTRSFVAIITVAILVSAASFADGEGEPRPLDLVTSEGTPFIRLRYVGDWLGAKLGYDAATRSITFALRGHTIRLKLGSCQGAIDDRPFVLGAPPTEVNGHTYVPLGFLDRRLGVPVEWNPKIGVARLMHPVSERFVTLRADAPADVGSPMAHAAPSATAPAWLEVADTLDLPESANAATFVVSDDGAHWAYVETMPDNRQRVLDDRNQSPGTYRLCRPPFFASGTHRLAYWALPNRGRAVLVADGQAFPTASNRPGMLMFSPDGKSWATVSFGGNPRRPESRFASVMLDGAEVGRYWDAGIPRFSPDSQHLAFLAIDAESQRLLVVVDGEGTEVSTDPAITLKYGVGPNLSFQTDLEYALDGTLHSIFHTNRGWEVRAGSRTLATYHLSKHNLDSRSAAGSAGHIIYPSSLVVASEAPVAAWWARGEQDSAWTCTLGGREVAASTETKPAEDRIAISPDGKHVAFRVRHLQGKGEARHQVAESVCCDGKVGERYEWVEAIAFSPGSTCCCYRARPLGTWRDMYIIDGLPAGPDGVHVTLLTFSSDDKHYAYASHHDSAAFIVCNGTEWPVPWPDIITLSITPDRRLTVTALEDHRLVVASGTPPN